MVWSFFTTYTTWFKYHKLWCQSLKFSDRAYHWNSIFYARIALAKTWETLLRSLQILIDSYSRWDDFENIVFTFFFQYCRELVIVHAKIFFTTLIFHFSCGIILHLLILFFQYSTGMFQSREQQLVVYVRLLNFFYLGQNQFHLWQIGVLME